VTDSYTNIFYSPTRQYEYDQRYESMELPLEILLIPLWVWQRQIRGVAW